MKNIDRKYANLLVETALNVQPNQTLIINAGPEHHEFVALLTEEAYKLNAKQVIVKFTSEQISRLHYLYQSEETLTHIPESLILEHDEYLKEDLVKLALRSPNPGLMNDVDASKVMAVSQVRGKALQAFANYSMSNQGQWLVAAYPTYNWAKAVFPELEAQAAYDKLYEYILYATRVTEDNDPKQEWEKHNAQLHKQNSALNAYNFESVHFKNGLGTDITIGLVKGHIWSGGNSPSQKGIPFNANVPTEESFTTPDRMNVNGIVFNTLPLNNNGRLIDKFWLKFEDGVVVDFDAEQGKEALESLLNTDENSRRIGEIALVSFDSPISNLKTLFYNTLFDENASCHIALGKGYPLIENGGSMDRDELLERGINQSLIHVDFMFGSEDMHAEGTTFDGNIVTIIKDGNIVL